MHVVPISRLVRIVERGVVWLQRLMRQRSPKARFTSHASSALRWAMQSPTRLEIDTRPISAQEVAVISALLARPLEGRDELRNQVKRALVTRGCDCGCPTVSIVADRTMPPARLPDGIVVEGQVYLDGMPLEVLLFVRDGYLANLELVWYGAQAPRDWPDPSSMDVYWEPTSSEQKSDPR